MREKHLPELEQPDSATTPQWQPPAGATVGVQSGARLRQSQRGLGLAATLASSVPTPASAAPEPPDVLPHGAEVGGRYVIERTISSGGFGAVYRASDKQIRNHQVALKLLHTPAGSDEARERALRELTLIASVSHPSIVQFKDYGWHEGRLWFAMPWYQGATLDQRWNAIARVEAQPIFQRLARGLAAMHEVGIHHHDIKPENIFLADVAGFEGGFPVLLDLGIAAERGETPAGLTVEYAAPETASAALGNPVAPLTGQADIFSLALVLRNLLEPETAPGTDAELLALLHRRATEPIAPPSSKQLRYLKAHFERWLSLDPDARPTAQEFAEELTVLSAPEERRTARRRLMRRLLPILALALIAVAGLYWQLDRQRNQLTRKQQELTEEKREHDELRMQADRQLEQLEEQMAAIGSKDRELSRAVVIARQLQGQLDRAESRGRLLSRRLKRTETERDETTRERDTLQVERDALQVERDGLKRNIESLDQQRDALTAERDALVERRDELRYRITQVEQALSAEREVRRAAEQRAASGELETKAMRAERDQLKDELAGLRRENARLAKASEKLERKIDALQQRLLRRGGTAQPPTPSPPAPDPPQTSAP